VTIDTGASATVARPDIVAGLPERELSRPYVLQTASGETKPVAKEARVELTMGRRTLRSWVFVADIKDDSILGLDILRAHDASVDIGSSETDAYGVGVEAGATHRESQELAAGVLAVRKDRSPLERVS
jgi:predicted aspartyl protease